MIFYKESKSKKIKWGGDAGMGRVRWGLEKVLFLYESKFKIIPCGWKRRGWDMARVSDCFFF